LIKVDRSNKEMRNVMLISHGKLSEGMAYSAQMIVGEKKNLFYYGLMPGGVVDDMIKQIRLKVEADLNNQYLVLSDLFGGSVCTGSVELQDLDNVKLATGMNLLMIVQFLLSDEDVTDEEFEMLVNSSIETVKVIPKVSGIVVDDANNFF
jgi:mannose/fructose-specific phosphotransferase system component IIA